MTRTFRAQKGFTLLELLVVIGVLAILGALLFPALNSARAKVKRTTCGNNLRQINLGVRMYSDDSRDAGRVRAWLRPGRISFRSTRATRV
jgi:prepilin-type N-terminal cleavage/methylation domain-containing protein